MTSMKILCIVLIAIEIGNSIQIIDSLNFPQGVTKPEQVQTINYQNRLIRQPLQFVDNNAPVQPLSGAHSNGQLYKPANNQVEVNNFYSISHPQTVLGNKASNSFPVLHTATSTHAINQQTAGKQLSARLQQQHSDESASSSHQAEDQVRGFAEGLQQAMIASEENPFYHSSSPALLERNLEWLSDRSSSVASSVSTPPAHSLDQQLPVIRSTEDQDQQEVSSSSSISTSTTEQSNNIAQIYGFSSPIYQHQSSREFPHQPALVVSQPGMLTNGSSTLTSLSAPTSGEIQNHVIYEGPATAPPVDDYYFSSSERLPNTEKASTGWWALGFGQEYDKASNLTSDDFLDFCSKSPLLESSKQRSLCRTHPKVMQIVARGIKVAIDECQSRFTSSRWNCSLVLQDTLDAENQSPQMFGEVMKHPNRERSFLNAIIAAGLAHAMTKACSQGELPGECSCDKRIRSNKNNRGKIEWVACSDDIDFGARFSRDFTDDTDYANLDTTSMINSHNYEVGRRIFKSSTDITCTCQNSLCQTKRCWKHLGPFSDIGDELMRRYESATHVHPSNKDPHKLRPVRRGVRKPKRKDLVYIDESPDYCSSNTRLGILGTQNRHCNSTSIGSDSCSLLCCGRGYQVVVEELEEDCNCKFVWCCQLKCDKCKRQITNDICN